MRLNKYIALATGMSRRAADRAIDDGRVRVGNNKAATGQIVQPNDTVTLDHQTLALPEIKTILFHKPAGYVCSRAGQGNKTIYHLLPEEYHELKPIGRLDKDSSGLLLLTNDGQLAQDLTHPSKQKIKIYEVTIDQPLAPLHRQMIENFGVMLDDGPSKLQLERLTDSDGKAWKVILREGRNRQIRRTFAALGYRVIKLHRTQFGDYFINDLKQAEFAALPNSNH